MKNKASVLTLRVPEELKHNIKNMADQQGISINQLALNALTKEIQEMKTYNQLKNYWINRDEKDISNDFSKLLEKVKQKDNQEAIPDWDAI
jgi:rubrerythrin